MAKLSKVDAAKATGVSRQILYTYIKEGRLSTDAHGLIDTAERLRAGFTFHTGHDIGRQDVMSTGQELTSKSATSGKAGGLKKVEPLKAVEAVNRSKRFGCEPPPGGPSYHKAI